MKPVGEPDAGNPHVRFDERGAETGPWIGLRHRHYGESCRTTVIPDPYSHRAGSSTLLNGTVVREWVEKDICLHEARGGAAHAREDLALRFEPLVAELLALRVRAFVGAQQIRLGAIQLALEHPELVDPARLDEQRLESAFDAAVLHLGAKLERRELAPHEAPA